MLWTSGLSRFRRCPDLIYGISSIHLLFLRHMPKTNKMKLFFNSRVMYNVESVVVCVYVYVWGWSVTPLAFSPLLSACQPVYHPSCTAEAH